MLIDMVIAAASIEQELEKLELTKNLTSGHIGAHKENRPISGTAPDTAILSEKGRLVYMRTKTNVRNGKTNALRNRLKQAAGRL